MAIIKTQKVPQKKAESARHVLARFCFYFSAYTYEEARKLPAKQVMMMLRIAEKENARKMYQLTQIVSAPQTKKGTGVKKMLDYFKNIIEGS